MSLKQWQGDFWGLKRGLLEKYDDYNPEQQGIIREGVPKLFSGVKKYQREDLFEAVQGFMPCEDLGQFKEKYPKELSEEILPGRCL